MVRHLRERAVGLGCPNARQHARYAVGPIGSGSMTSSAAEAKSELESALAECRAQIRCGNGDDRTVKRLSEAVSKIELALKLLKRID